MKLKTLLLLPFLLTGCSGNNIPKESSEQLPLTELPAVTQSNEIAPSSSDNESSVPEQPLSDLPKAEMLANIRTATPNPVQEKICEYVAEQYIGRNILLDSDITTPAFLDEEHNPFVPQVFERMNEYYDGNFFSTKNNCTHVAHSFEDLCSQFLNYYVYDSYGSIFYSQKEEDAYKALRDAKIQKHLGQFFPKTRFDKGIPEVKTYAIITDIRAYTYIARYDLRDFRNFYKQSYINELKTVLEKNDYETYYNFFEKWGTECINAATFASKRMIYLGFSGNVTFDIRVNNQEDIQDVITELVKDNGNITLNDYYISESKTSADEEDGSGLRLISYRTIPFHHLLPEDLRQYRDQIDAAYEQYTADKTEVVKKEVAEQVKEQNYINDAYYQETGEATVNSKKPFKFDFNFKQEDEMLNPEVMNSKGYTKMFMRPRIKVDDGTNYDSEIIIMGKRAKVKDEVWYEINFQELEETGYDVSFKLTPETTSHAKVSLEFCYMK